MSGFYPVKRRWTSPPPVGTPLDQSNQFTRKLAVFIMPGPGLSLYDAVSNQVFTDVPDNVANMERRYGRTGASGGPIVELGQGIHLPYAVGNTGYDLAGIIDFPCANQNTIAMGCMMDGLDTATADLNLFRLSNSGTSRYVELGCRTRAAAPNRQNATWTLDMKGSGTTREIRVMDVAALWSGGDVGIYIVSDNDDIDFAEFLRQNGVVSTSTTVNAQDNTTLVDLHIRNDAAASAFNWTFFFGAYWNERALSLGEKRAFQADPWQIFEPRTVWIPLGVEVDSGTHDLFATSIESASEVSAPSVGQVHVLLSVSTESTSEASAPVLGGTHALLATSIESTSEVSAPVLSESNILLADNIESASETSSSAIGQEHVFLADDLESASEVDTPGVGQVHVLLAGDIEAASELSAPAVTEVVDGVDALPAADNIEVTSEVSAPAIGQEHVLFAGDVESISELSTPTLDRVEGSPIFLGGANWGSANLGSAYLGGRSLAR